AALLLERHDHPIDALDRHDHVVDLHELRPQLQATVGYEGGARLRAVERVVVLAGELDGTGVDGVGAVVAVDGDAEQVPGGHAYPSCQLTRKVSVSSCVFAFTKVLGLSKTILKPYPPTRLPADCRLIPVMVMLPCAVVNLNTLSRKYEPLV